MIITFEYLFLRDKKIGPRFEVILEFDKKRFESTFRKVSFNGVPDLFTGGESDTLLGCRFVEDNGGRGVDLFTLVVKVAELLRFLEDIVRF